MLSDGPWSWPSCARAAGPGGNNAKNAATIAAAQRKREPPRARENPNVTMGTTPKCCDPRRSTGAARGQAIARGLGGRRRPSGTTPSPWRRWAVVMLRSNTKGAAWALRKGTKAAAQVTQEQQFPLSNPDTGDGP